MKFLTLTLYLLLSTSLYASADEVEITLDKQDKNLLAEVDAIYSSRNYLCKRVGFRNKYTIGLHNKVHTVRQLVSSNKIKVPKNLNTFCMYELHSMTFKILNQLVPSSDRMSYIAVKEGPKGTYGTFVKNCRLIDNSDPKARYIFPKLMDCYGDVITLNDDNKAEIKINTNF